MALPVRQQATYWGIAAALFFAVLWGLGNVILPFVVGGALAYFLDPVADRLERAGLSRAAATSVISIAALLAFVLLALLIVPMLVRQLVGLVNAAPTIFSQLHEFLATRFPVLLNDEGVVRDTLDAIGQTIKARGGELAQGLLTSALSVINAIVFIVVVPVVTFYLLLDWDNMIAKIDGWLPRDHRGTVRALARDIDRVLAGFVRGQVSVCLILGTFYSVTLMLAGLGTFDKDKSFFSGFSYHRRFGNPEMFRFAARALYPVAQCSPFSINYRQIPARLQTPPDGT